MSALAALNLANNSLTGTIPASWYDFNQLFAWSTLALDKGIFLHGNAGLSGCIDSLRLLAVLKGPSPEFDSSVDVYKGPYSDAGRFNGTGLTVSNCPALAEAQRTVLLDSKVDSVFGFGGTVLTAWNDTSFPCVNGQPAWPGITSCDGELVRAIDLSNKGLVARTVVAYKLSTLVTLQSITLDGNLGISGILPPQWSTLTNLVTLSARGCNIEGSIPRQWGQGWVNMVFMNVAKNRLGGTVPQEWSTMRNLLTFDVFENKLTGTLPPNYSTMENLFWFLGDSNLFNGSLPSAWSTLTKMTTLGLSKNQIGGSLPPEWSTLNKLAVLALHDNNLTSTIPPAWNLLFPTANLPRVFLYNNAELAGCFPNGIMRNAAKGDPFDPNVPIRSPGAYSSTGRVAGTSLSDTVCIP